VDRAVTATLFQRLLGTELDTVGPGVRRLHARGNGGRHTGEVEVERGRGSIAALCIRAMRLPPAGRGPIEVDVVIDGDTERWTRHIGGQAMRSQLWAEGGLLWEKIGPVTLGFRLGADAGAIVWRVVAARWFGLPFPASAFTHVGAREYDEAGRYHFDVSATLPSIGLLVRYRGWLDVA
jgi:hypothetical protein